MFVRVDLGTHNVLPWPRLDAMRAKVRESLQLLYRGRKSRLDVLLLHSPRCWRGHCSPEEEAFRWQDAWRNIEVLYDEAMHFTAYPYPF